MLPQMLYLDISCQFGPHLARHFGEGEHKPICRVDWLHAKGHNVECQKKSSALHQACSIVHTERKSCIVDRDMCLWAGWRVPHVHVIQPRCCMHLHRS